MEESFLKKIDRYIKENGIPFKDFYFKASGFPQYFKKAVMAELNFINSIYNNVVDDTYTFSYDNNGNLVFICTSNNEKTKLVIYDSNEDISLDFPCTLLSMRKFLEILVLEKYLRQDAFKIQSLVNRSSVSNRGEKDFLSINLENVLLDEVRKTCHKNNIDILNLADCSETLDKVTKDVIDYIDYLNKEYIKTKELDVVYYTPTESETNIVKTEPTIIDPKESKERLNDIIPTSDRDDFLVGLPGLNYACAAASSKSEKPTHMCYVYQLENGESKLILEPFSGEARTKIVSFISDDLLTPETASNLIKYCLELSDVETKEAENIVRVNHTNMESFKKTILYSLTKDAQKYQCSTYTKYNIDNSVPVYLEDMMKTI